RGPDAGPGEGGQEGQRKHDPAVQHAFVAEVAGPQQRGLARQDHPEEDRSLAERQPAGEQVQPGTDMVPEPLQEIHHPDSVPPGTDGFYSNRAYRTGSSTFLSDISGLSDRTGSDRRPVSHLIPDLISFGTTKVGWSPARGRVPRAASSQ